MERCGVSRRSWHGPVIVARGIPGREARSRHSRSLPGQHRSADLHAGQTPPRIATVRGPAPMGKTGQAFRWGKRHPGLPLRRNAFSWRLDERTDTARNSATVVPMQARALPAPTPSHSSLTDWPDSTGPGRTVRTPVGSWPAATDLPHWPDAWHWIYGSVIPGACQIRARTSRRWGFAAVTHGDSWAQPSGAGAG